MVDWGSGLKGAGGGALAGAAIGGPIGGLVGGGIGLIGGLFGNGNQDDMRQKLQDYYDKIQNRGAGPQSATSGFRSNQTGLIQQLEAMGRGQGPSASAQQFQAATDRNNSAQMSMANSGRGGPMAQLTAANNMGMMGAQTAQGAAMGRTQEQLGALGQLGGVIGQARGQDEANSQANMMAQLQKMGMDQQGSLQVLAQMQGNNAQPSMGDQILAGGAGMYGLKFGQMGGNGGPLTGGSDPSKYWQGSKGSQYQSPYGS